MVRVFAEAGHTIAGCARRSEIIGSLEKEFPVPHRFFVTDVSSDGETRKFCEKSLEATGPPDLLINNAAIINPSAPLWEIDAEAFNQLVAINICGTANMIRHTVPIMAKAGKGVIVNMSSGWGRSVSPEVAPYCASKWAIEGLTRALAMELPTGLAAVALNPGIIDTEMLRSCFGNESAGYRGPVEWAETAVPFLVGLGSRDNGASLTAP